MLHRAHQRALRLEALLSNIDATNNSEKQIGIPNDAGVEFVSAGEIICCQGIEGYTRIYLSDNSQRTSSYPIGHYKKMLPTPDFFMTHRSYVVNRRHVLQVAGDEIALKQSLTAEISRRRKKLVEEWLS